MNFNPVKLRSVKNNFRQLCLFTLGITTVIGVHAQQDSTKPKDVKVTSAFKPTLKEAAKINFTPSPLVADTARPRLQYSIPNQNLALGFQPGSLKPLALQIDTGGRWDNENYLKLGYGSFKTPFAQAGFSFGDNRTAGLNVYAKHVASEGNIPFQDYSNTAVDLSAFLKSANNIEWSVRFGGFREMYKNYGFEPKTLAFPDDSINVRYQTWRGRAGFRNINRTGYGLTYSPEIRTNIFYDDLDNSEKTLYAEVPLQKAIDEAFSVDVALAASLSKYSPRGKNSISNNFVAFSPSLNYKKANISIQGGLRPSWDNGDFVLFPNVLAEFSPQAIKFSLQLGWTGYLRNSGFQYQAGFNPWIWAPSEVYNTRITERFVGIKGTAGDHFTFSAKASRNTLENQPLFINDTATGKSFQVLNEPRVRVSSIGGELGYTIGEKFSTTSNLTINKFNTKQNSKAWGLLPIEWKTNLRLQLIKDLYVNSTLFVFDGPWSLTKAGRKNLPVYSDLSAGLEFKVVKNIKLWAQFNNIFNKSYQRWNQYPVYGFNFLGGVVFSFAQKN